MKIILLLVAICSRVADGTHVYAVFIEVVFTPTLARKLGDAVDWIFLKSTTNSLGPNKVPRSVNHTLVR